MARKKKGEAQDRGFDEQAAPSAGRPRLTPVDVQQKVFRLAFRGYNERDVDEFLDKVTEDLAALHEENKRLRESGGGGGADLDAARSQAETIVREAREHAARLIEEAEAGTGQTAPGLSAAFLVRERDFLQRLAQSVQEHARWMKAEAQRQRASSAAVPVKPSKKAKASSRSTAASAAAEPAASGPVDAGDATAAWGPPQEGMAEPAGGWQEPTGNEPDPLLAAWESAFTGEPSRGSSEKSSTAEGEPSLRELFWGEE